MQRFLIKSLVFCVSISLYACGTNDVNIHKETIKNEQVQEKSSEILDTVETHDIDTTTQPSVLSDKTTSKPLFTVSENSTWYPLYIRLMNDGIVGTDVDHYFEQLEDNFSPVPMGTKVTELYNISFKERPKPSTPPRVDTSPNTTGIPRPWYKGFVVEENALKCHAFIKANQEAFNLAEELYYVPQNVLAALLYIETKHGTYLGIHNPIVNLASMANSTRMEQIPDHIAKLPLALEKKDWILKKMKEKSDWAYIELKALIKYCRENDLNPFQLPSSVYGALGFGQFMPTNIPIFAVDGDADGVINLFTPADAIMSTANYLSKHGWTKEGMTLEKQIKVIKRYNHSTTYANTILALAVLTSRVK